MEPTKPLWVSGSVHTSGQILRPGIPRFNEFVSLSLTYQHLRQQRVKHGSVKDEHQSEQATVLTPLCLRPLCRGWGETYLIGFLRGALGGGRGRRGRQPALALPVPVPMDQLAVGLLQRPLELIDAGLMLQQHILRLVEELRVTHRAGSQRDGSQRGMQSAGMAVVAAASAISTKAVLFTQSLLPLTALGTESTMTVSPNRCAHQDTETIYAASATSLPGPMASECQFYSHAKGLSRFLWELFLTMHGGGAFPMVTSQAQDTASAGVSPHWSWPLVHTASLAGLQCHSWISTSPFNL